MRCQVQLFTTKSHVRCLYVIIEWKAVHSDNGPVHRTEECRMTDQALWNLDDKTQAERVPDALRDRDQWLLARRNPNDEERDKVPLSPTDPTDTTSGLSFDEAIEGLVSPDALGIGARLRKDERLALGFMISTDDPFVFIDWDDVRDPTRPHVPQLIRDEVTELGGYVEVSVSGTGLHQVGIINSATAEQVDDYRSKGSIPLSTVGDNTDEPHVEVYHRDHYMTVTGQSPEEFEQALRELKSMSGTIQQELSDYIEQRHYSSPGTGGGSQNLTDLTDGLAQKRSTDHMHIPGDHVYVDEPSVSQVRATGYAYDQETFRPLWEGKNLDHATTSEADCAFASRLWYYCDDRDLVDRCFRASERMRPKWERRSYRQATLESTKDNDRHDGRYIDPDMASLPWELNA